ncbi:MAG: glucosyltransferase domain-containing protein [Cyanobacteria bacterium]|nr:glucosyltransferase domain-containing protein [Cyanobacteria bacterium bin.51]
MQRQPGSDVLGGDPVLGSFSSAFLGPGAIPQFKACLASEFFLVLPILLFVHRYIDDYGRSMDGEFRWTEVGRPLADGLFALVNLGAPAVAVAPLHQLLAVGVLALTAVVAARAYGLRSPLWSALATLPLMGQPYALENLSYGFDCLAMALAVGLAVVAAVVLHRVVSGPGLLVSSALLLASLCLYQPATSGFLPFALMLVVGEILGLAAPISSGRPSLRRRLVRVLVTYGFALFSYLMLMRLVLEESSSYSTERARALPLDTAMPAQLLRHALEFWRIVFDDWSRWPISAPWLLLLLAYAVVVWIMVGRWQRGRSSRPARLGCTVLVLGAVAMIALVSPGALLGLQDPMARVPRLLLFLGPLLSALALQIVAGTTQLRWRLIPRGAVVLLAWSLVVVAYTYGHATAAQAIYEQGRITRLIEGISQLQVRLPDATLKAIHFEGFMPQSPVLRNSQTKLPVLVRLVPRLISDDWWWGHEQLRFHGLELEYSQLEPGAIADEPCVPSDTTACSTEYSLHVKNETLLVRMR